MRLKTVDDQEFNLTDFIENLLKKNNDDPNKAIAILAEENYNLRQSNRELKAATNLPEGAVVLKGDDVKLFETYKTLGKPEDIQKVKIDLEEAQATNSDLQLNLTVADAATLHNLKPSVLRDLVKSNQLQLERGTTEVTDKDGNKTKQPAMLVKLSDGQNKVLTEYLKETHPDYMPALKVEQAEGAGVQGTAWVRQEGGSGGVKATTESLASKMIQNRYGEPAKKEQ